MSLSTKLTQGERREGERERKRVDGGKKERESLEDMFQATVTEARSALGLSSYLS